MHAPDAIWALVKPMMIGSIILGLPVWLLFYFSIRYIVAATKSKRAAYFTGLADQRRAAREQAAKEAESDW